MPGISEMKNAETPNKEQPTSDERKARIISDFILSSPPGEFGEVLNDVRVLLNDDRLLKDVTSAVVAEYDKERLVTATIGSRPVLISRHNNVDDSRFVDPRSALSFVYDHVKKCAGQCEPFRYDDAVELRRGPFQEQLDAYVASHYPDGTCNVFADLADATTLVACVECHDFQPKNFWNGQWRSQWSVTCRAGVTDLAGALRVQVHYYENGNVQLVCSKEVRRSFDHDCAAAELVAAIEESEGEYQKAICDDYRLMSESVFKTLRRQLPVTRTRVDWEKIVKYSVTKELKSQ